ncbi:MAG TPA: carboxylesterase, partial [Variovorax sp.]|nr:carboxylesterase [Variovorax sp.]
NLTAKKEGDGSIKIQFGGCEGQAVNCLPIVPGWNYTVRLYRPRAEVLSGAWQFPQPQPVN